MLNAPNTERHISEIMVAEAGGSGGGGGGRGGPPKENFPPAMVKSIMFYNG